MLILLITDMAGLSAATGTVPTPPFCNESRHLEKSLEKEKSQQFGCYWILSLSLLVVFIGGILVICVDFPVCSRWWTVVMQRSFCISEVSVSESEESLQPDPGSAHHLHTRMATPDLTPLPHPSGLRWVLSEPAQPGEQHQTRRISQRWPGPLHQGQWDSGQ